MKFLIQLMSLVFMLLASSAAMAGAMCTDSDVTLDFIQLAYDPLTPAPEIPDPIPFGSRDASDCILLLGNDQPIPMGHNIGEYQDGLLNGEVWLPSPDPRLSEYNTLFDPFYDSVTPITPLVQNGDDGYNAILFINPLTDLQDLDDTDGNTNKTDPGWVYLGKDEGDDFQYSRTGVGVVDDFFDPDFDDPGYVPSGLEGIAIEKLLNISFTCSDESAEYGSFNLGDVYTEGNDIGKERNCTMGTWSIMPDFDIVAKLDELFGEGVFDHLAFVFKSGNVCHPPEDDNDVDIDGKEGCIDALEGPQFAIYDFNFTDIFDSFPGGNAEEALQSPFNLGGMFNLGTTFHGHGISHISALVRDPASTFTTTEMPEPKSTMLMLFALALLLLRFKSKHAL